jgi:Protein of unknown function (DUF1569)
MDGFGVNQIYARLATREPTGSGTSPTEFVSDLEKLRILLERFCNSEGEFAPHATLGQLSRTERMRHAYLHIDHHLRQFGA